MIFVKILMLWMIYCLYFPRYEIYRGFQNSVESNDDVQQTNKFNNSIKMGNSFLFLQNIKLNNWLLDFFVLVFHFILGPPVNWIPPSPCPYPCGNTKKGENLLTSWELVHRTNTDVAVHWEYRETMLFKLNNLRVFEKKNIDFSQI